MMFRALLLALLLNVPWTPACGNPSQTGVERLVKESEALLDGWTGERGILIEADKKISAALAQDPRSSPAMVQRARLLLMAGWNGGRPLPESLDAAEKTLLAAAEADPKASQPHVLLGHVYTLKKDLRKAQASLVRAQQMGSTDPWLYLNLASYYKEMRDPGSVVVMSRKAIASGKANTKALAVAHENLLWVSTAITRDRKQADEHYRAMVALQPAQAFTRGNYARNLIVAFHDYAAAETLAREAIAIMRYPHAMQTLSMALYGQWAVAVDGKAPAKDIARLYAQASGFDPGAQMIPECATPEPAMQSVIKHLGEMGRPAGVQRC